MNVYAICVFVMAYRDNEGEFIRIELYSQTMKNRNGEIRRRTTHKMWGLSVLKCGNWILLKRKRVVQYGSISFTYAWPQSANVRDENGDFMISGRPIISKLPATC